MANAGGVRRSTVQCIWDTHGLRPHRVTTFKLSKDTAFVEKLSDVVGLYLNSPDKAVVRCVDENATGLDRASPAAGPGSLADTGTGVTPAKSMRADGDGTRDESRPVRSHPDFYRLFRDWMGDVTAADPIGADDIAGRLGLKKAQAAAWLKRGIDEKRVRKLAKPVRYQATSRQSRQASLLRDKA